MSRRREKSKVRNTLNSQLLPTPQREKASFYPVASDIVFDLAKLVFGGGIIGGWFEEIGNPWRFYTASSILFLVLLVLGYLLFRLGNNKKSD